jgi:hypothetical protein
MNNAESIAWVADELHGINKALRAAPIPLSKKDRRERIAMAVLAGTAISTGSASMIAERAVELADALIAELKKAPQR